MQKPPSEAAGPGTRAAFRFPWRVFLILAGVYLISVAGRLPVVDQAIMFAQTRSLLHGKLSISGVGLDHVTPVGVDGLHYSQYGVLMPVLWLPSTLAVRVVAALVPRFPLKMLEEFAASFINVAASLGILGYLVLEWRRRGVSESMVRFGLWGVGLSSLLWAYAKMPFSDPWMALGLFAAFCHWRWRSNVPSRALGLPHAVWCGFWLGVALLSRKQAQMLVPMLLVFFAWEVRRGPWTDLFRVVAAFLPAVMIQALYNYGRFGNPLLERYPYADTLAPAGPVQIASNFVLVFVDAQNGFIPFNLFVIALAVIGAARWWRSDPIEALLPWGLLLASAAFLSRYWFWNGGLCFGSRYLLFMIPFFGLGLAALHPLKPALRVGLTSVIALGASIQLAGVLVDPLAVTWRMQFVEPKPASTPVAYVGEVRRVLTQSQPTLNSEGQGTAYATHPAFRVPDLWWAHFAYELTGRGVSRPAASTVPEGGNR